MLNRAECRAIQYGNCFTPNRFHHQPPHIFLSLQRDIEDGCLEFYNFSACSSRDEIWWDVIDEHPQYLGVLWFLP